MEKNVSYVKKWMGEEVLFEHKPRMEFTGLCHSGKFEYLPEGSCKRLGVNAGLVPIEVNLSYEDALLVATPKILGSIITEFSENKEHVLESMLKKKGLDCSVKELIVELGDKEETYWFYSESDKIRVVTFILGKVTRSRVNGFSSISLEEKYY